MEGIVKMRYRTKAGKQKFWKIAILIVILMGVVGPVFGIITVGMPLNEAEFQECAYVGQQIYDQIGNGAIEVPAGYIFEQTETQIRITKEHRAGSATAILQNDDLVFEHENGILQTIVLSIIMSLISMIITWFIVGGVAKAVRIK